MRQRAPSELPHARRELRVTGQKVFLRQLPPRRLSLLLSLGSPSLSTSVLRAGLRPALGLAECCYCLLVAITGELKQISERASVQVRHLLFTLVLD